MARSPSFAVPGEHAEPHSPADEASTYRKVTWRIGYQIEYPTDFVARSRAAEESNAPSSPAPAPRMKGKKMYEQIDALEQAL